MEIAITVLEDAIKKRNFLLKKEDLMRNNIKEATFIMKEISKLKNALKLLKSYQQRPGKMAM